MSAFLLALQFLTIIPIRVSNVNERKIANSMIFFPLIGLILGGILVGADKLFCGLGLWQLSINIILVILLIALTGGLHLDGLADTLDAALSRKNKEEMLRIMRDSHIGVMGVLGLISIILLKIALVSSIDIPIKAGSLLLMCVLSRWVLVYCIFLFSYARENGKAKVFIQGINLKIFTFATIFALICVFAICKIAGLVLMAIICVIAYILGKIFVKKFGGITGDTLGAMNEIIEVTVLFTIFILERSSIWIA